MQILENIKVPTGNILIVEGECGKLECLSLGDYGKDVNVKADFLGVNRELDQVKHQQLLPLTEKIVCTISTQYGCMEQCQFCSVPKVGSGRNATYNDILNQVYTCLSLHPELTYSKRLNIHYARMGEPTWNFNVLDATYQLYGELNFRYNIHPVISTMMPYRNKNLLKFLMEWNDVIKNKLCHGNAGLQLSINSTNERERETMFNGRATSLFGISEIMRYLDQPKGRKWTLNFALANYEINPKVLLTYFDPSNYIIKLTPMHKTPEAIANNIKTHGDYTTYTPYKEIEEKLKGVGYDVLVFIASKEEDEGRITCGNAILSGTRPFDV
jgi:23S rRNA (adenine2503-C2)-methyltransferase